MKTYLNKLLLVPILLALLATLNSPLSTASAQSTAFTYQGRVTDNGTNFDGSGQFKFALVTTTNTHHTATATASLGGGSPYYVSGYNLISGGNGYQTAPAVTVSGGGGVGATAVAVINGSGVVTEIDPQNVGAGYTSAPLVTIAPPPPVITYTTYWSNDGNSVAGSEPTEAVSVPVHNGLFTVVLGDATIPNMTAMDASLFSQPNLQLRIWFSDGVNAFAALDPAQPLTPAPYAVMAESTSNLLGNVPAAQVSGAIPATQLSGTILTANLPNGLGGFGNIANGYTATVGGGGNNQAYSEGATVGGGEHNSATNLRATVSGGFYNVAGGDTATVAGGFNGLASGSHATVGGGGNNVASGSLATVGGGDSNQATNTDATVPGGKNNVAGGQSSFAAGQRAKAVNDGAFVWADSQAADFSSTANDQFLIRARGGVGIGTPAPGTLLDVQGAGTASGGVSGYNEAVARFKNTSAGTHTAMSIDSLAGQSSILYLAEGGAAKWDLRRDGNPGGNEAFEMRWHGNGGNTSQLTLTTNGNLSVTGGLRLNDQPIYLRTGGDVNHGLGYNGGTVTNFGTGQYQIDGPALWGFNGGLLGTKNGGDHAALQWNTTGVTVNGDATVNGNLNANNTPRVNWNQKETETITVNSSGAVITSFGNVKPGPGFFVIIANVQVYYNGNTVELDLLDVTSGSTALTGVYGAGQFAGTLSLFWVVPIASGGGYENFQITAYTPNGTSTVQGHNVTVMYFPLPQNN